MLPSLCETFRSLAFGAFAQLGRARAVDHQPLEETITDTNILELKVRHGDEIYSQTYNKREEGVNGAEWQWWLTNRSMTSWLGLRIQAKILNLESNSFEHLHYRSGKSKTYQSAKLKRESAKEGLVPLYCFYTHQAAPSHSTHRQVVPHRCGSFPHAPESFGCALTSVAHVELLLKNGALHDYASVIGGATPWHCLVCCSGYGGSDLPSRAWSLLQRRLGIKAPRRTADAIVQSLKGMPIGPRLRAPDYVQAIVEKRRSDVTPPGVHGVLILRGAKDD